MPHRCVFSGRSGAKQGPYLETDLWYYNREGEGGEFDTREHRLQISSQVLIEWSRQPNSPIVTVPKEDYQALIEDQHKLTEEKAALEKVLEDALKDRDRYKKDVANELKALMAEVTSTQTNGVKRRGRPPKAESASSG